jgi:hypothetical protein
VVAEEALKVAVAQEGSVPAVAEDSREVVMVSEGHDIAFGIRVCSSLEPQRGVYGGKWRKELGAGI